MSVVQTLNGRGAYGRAVVAVLSALMLTGCHNRVAIPVPGSSPPRPAASVPAELKAGDHVWVMMRLADAEFVVAEVQPEALVAQDGRRFAYADIARLEKTRFSVGKTIALTAGLVFVLISAAAGIGLTSAAGGS